MATFHIENFGCRATQADAAAIERGLLERGLSRVARAAEAEVVVINTCTVTANADSQARQAIRHAHRVNPLARILVTGCYAQRASEELAQIEGVTWVVGNSHLHEIPRLMGEVGAAGPKPAPSNERALAGVPARLDLFPLKALCESDPFSLSRGPAKILTGDIFQQSVFPSALVAGGEGDHTRPTLKIQDGCNKRCAYCVIPFVRGHSRSMPADEVIAEIRRLVGGGAKEIVLSGINLGSYGRDFVPRMKFIVLLRRVLDETALDRLRVSSMEPMDVTQDFVELVAASGGRIAPHFHMPLQSGSDRILAAMHRWYRVAHYARRMELIKELLPDAAIGADVIVGFPGETEADYGATHDFIVASPFTYLHIFSFSKRPGTAAEKLTADVPPGVIKQRSKELRALGAEKALAFREAQAGRTERALTLHTRGQDSSGTWTEALTGNFLHLRVRGSRNANGWVNVIVPSAGEGASAVPA